ncbi:capsid protein [Cyclovirus TsCyV-1_JP-NUBS-2014]|uniref:Capsid protein n=1 Tax=Cyclovirus TsCyV-1_JP-NUBS-2014 TaxID=1592764 RepID=A0A0H5BG84_9CIRC|nr:capsid protein [Cyclovirus TsCyV-1_JP-NUBS-2014]BAS01236.1 capsid protein [Cyclovirus TsCyV-1_JP-NUBS-2014]
MVARRFRRVVRRRRPLRRAGVYRRRRRPTYRRKKAGRGSFRFKFTRLISITQDLAKTSLHDLSFQPNDFAEFTNLAANFEAYRFTKLRIRVLPQQNVSNNSSSLIGDYALLPWHRGVPTNFKFDDFISVDKAKIYRGTTCSSMTFVPSTLDQTLYQDKVGNFCKVAYRPRIEITDAQSLGIQHYTGLMAMQALTDAPDNAKAHYNLIYDVWCTMINQQTLKKY